MIEKIFLSQKLSLKIYISQHQGCLVKPYCRLFISRLETDSFVFFSSRFYRSTNIITKSVEYEWVQKTLQQEKTFFLRSSSLFLRTFVSSLLNKKSMAKHIEEKYEQNA